MVAHYRKEEEQLLRLAWVKAHNARKKYCFCHTYNACGGNCLYCAYIFVHKPLSGDITAAGNQFSGMGAAAVPAAFVYAFIQTGLTEEILFRGFILKRTANKFGFAAGNTVQAVLFGLLHGIPFGLSTHNIAVTFLLTLLPAAIGWYMGWLNEKRCGGSIFSSRIVHGTMNLIVTILAL